MSALSGLRVVELGGMETLYAGKLMADQGAEVLLIEPADGHVSRSAPPIVPGPVDDVSSAVFTYLNGHKHTTRLPAEPDEARHAIREMLSGADVILAGGRPRDLLLQGADPQRWSERHLIVTVTPFGWSGPWSELSADELVLNALGGMMSLGGYWDGRPLQPPAGLAYASAGTFAAVGAMTHLVSGGVRPGHVDVSIQESVVMGLENAAQFWDLEGVDRRRSGDRDTQVGRGVYACADGYVYLMLGLSAGSAFWTRFLAWLDDWDAPGRDGLRGPEWTERRFIESDAARDTFRNVVETLFLTRSKADLYEAARTFGVPLAPVSEMEDLLTDEQLAARGFLVDVPATDWPHGPARAPGAPYRLDRTPASTRYAPQRFGAVAEVRG